MLLLKAGGNEKKHLTKHLLGSVSPGLVDKKNILGKRYSKHGKTYVFL
jgi:hypothetical protein